MTRVTRSLTAADPRGREEAHEERALMRGLLMCAWVRRQRSAAFVISGRVSLAAWEHTRGEVTPITAALIAAGQLEPPDLHVEIVGRRDEYATVLILSGQLRAPSSLLFIERYGAFEIVHVEPWSPSGRFLVVRQMQRS